MMEKISKWIARISMFVSASCLGVLAIVMIMQIFCRKVLNNSLSWSDEMGGYLLVWIALYGAVAALYEKRHLAIDALVEKLSDKMQRAARLLVDVLMMVFVVTVFYYSLPLMTKLSGMTAISLPIPRTLIYSSLLITAAFSVVILLNDAIKDVKAIMNAKEDRLS